MEALTPPLEVWRGLLRGQRSMLLRLAAHLKSGFDLTTAQYEALLTVYENGGTVSAGELSRNLLYTSGSTTHLIARLEERGLLARDADPADARRVRVSLTDAGHHLIVEATEAHVADIEREFSPLVTGADQDALLRFARRLAEAEGVVSQPFPA
ncbi:MarR family transcriptional regulator [Tessaracoccus lubricantis]|uniref:MarR family transcriptional regulator n=2 Tax=Tessaracoccus lubricantis TaxID=545543 RepID=A0ABP9EZ99_9ACTN